MKYYSTNNHNSRIGFAEAVRKGLPDDGGLFMPTKIPQLPESFIESISSLSLPEIGYEILQPFVFENVPDAILKEICADAFSFPLPLVELKKNLYSLELYHGPTLAFKDFGARFMARILGYFNATGNNRNIILVATSGDTGSAVADGFYQVENVDVIILYPNGKVSDLQEKQMTTLGSNIKTIAIEGNFDDCQRLVKMAFLDADLAARYGLTSANSINIARLLPQMLYYFYAFGQVANNNKPVVFSVPSGNYGNITAGMIAKRMGLPVKHFIAAANANDSVPHYLNTGNFEPKQSIETISNAMDVGNPSNFARLQTIFNQSLASFRSEISGYSFSDEETRESIKEVYDEYNYLTDPHGAVGYRALREYLTDNDDMGIFLETAHPIKFSSEVEAVLGLEIPLPESLEAIFKLDQQSFPCSSDYNDFKRLIEKLIGP